MSSTQLLAAPLISFDDFEDGLRMMVDVFGFRELAMFRNDAGEVEHCELAWGETVFMPTPRGQKSIWTPGPVSTYLAVQDPDAHHAKSVAAGLEVIMPLTDQDYGSREYAVRDSSANVWIFGTYRPVVSENQAGS